MKKFKLIRLNLHLFDGASVGSAAAEGGAGDTISSPVVAGQDTTGDNDLSRVIYGKQPADAGAADNTAGNASAADSNNSTNAAPSKTDLNAEFDELIKGKYKDIYTAKTQQMIDRRFKAAKETEAKLNAIQPALDTLANYYGITNDADLSKLAEAISKDDSYIDSAAEDAGMSTEAYREVARLRRENEAYAAARNNDIAQQQIKADAERMQREAAALKEKYPQFDLQEFLQDAGSLAAFRAGSPLENVYWASHHDELLAGEIAKAQSQAAKSVVDNVRARGSRPVENGAGSQSAAFITKSDPSQLTLADYEEIAKRVRAGEVISF